MESTRAIGYSLKAAIADIIDNSIAADATEINVDFFPVGDEYIAILDNGKGMNSEEIDRAMQYGSKNPNDVRNINDLGRFGLGLKTASLSQCRRLSVVTKKNGSIEARRWDLDHVIKAETWSLIVLEDIDVEVLPCIEKFNKLVSGTLVVWQNLDRLRMGEINFTASFGSKMDEVREHLALVFHRYISGEPGINKVSIKINNNTINAADPFLIKKSTQLMDNEKIYINGQEMVVKPYILPHTSKLSEKELKILGGKDGLRKLQGFYVYRNKRLLVWGTWFRLMRQGDLSKLARVQVDIPNSLDDLWILDIKKSTAYPPEEVRSNLANIVNKIGSGSKRTWTFRGKVENDDSKIHIWNRIKAGNGGIVYEINADHPFIDSMIAKYPDIKKELLELLKQVEGNLPLNSLYIDLTNDEKIRNETEIDSSKVIKMLRNILSQNDSELHDSLIDTLINVDPFCNFIDEIEDARKKGVLV
jgi:hypothetical protein